MRRRSAVLVALLAASAVAALGAGAGTQTEPGISARTIVIGGTFPLSGPAASYAPIPVGMRAYFSYVNARRGPDGKRGVYGRQIVWKYYDDGYNPPTTVQQTRRLVEQDKVFALFGGLGTEPQQAVEKYLNDAKVPQLLVSTGATEFGSEFKQYPYTMGWEPDYVAEGTIYGKYISAHQPDKKIGVIYQDDSYGQDYVKGLKQGLGSKQSLIASSQPFDVAAPGVVQQVIALKQAGVDIVCIFALPARTIQIYATMAKVGLKPGDIYVNHVSATDTFMKLSVANSSADEVNGSVSVGFVKDPQSPLYANDAGMKLYRQIIARYGGGANVNDGLVAYGVAKAYDVVQLLYKAGKNPTRASLMAAAQHMDWVNPFLIPGIRVHTKANFRFPVTQVKLIRFNNGLWQEFGSLINGRGK